MKAIFEPVYNTAGVEQLNKELAKDGGRTVMVSGCIDTQKLHFSSAIASNYNFQLVITSDEGKARDMAEDARFFNGGNVMYYPAKDVIFYNADVQGRQIAGERIRCIAAIIDRLNKSDIVKSGTEKSTEKASDGPLTIVTTIDGISDMLLPVDRFKRAVINLKKGDILDVEDMAKKLTAMGFERFGMVEAKGQFAIRGGIIDIFDVTSDTPVRMELWGDSVDSIRTFNAESQKSISEIDKLRIFPATDMLFSDDEIQEAAGYILSDIAVRLDELGDNNKKKDSETYERCNRLRALSAIVESNSVNPKFISYYEKNISYLLDYFDENTLISLVEPMLLSERFEELNTEYTSSMESRYAEGYCLEQQTHGLKNISEMYKSLEKRKCGIFTSFDSKIHGIKTDCTVSIRAISAENYNNAFDLLLKELKSYQKRNYRICLVTSSTARKERLIKELSDNEVRAYNATNDDALVPGTVAVMLGGLSEGFEYPENKFVCISENDIFKEKKRKKQKRKHIDITELDIVPGDYVVHENHGLGIYQGIEKIEKDHVTKDYLKVAYAAGSNLYVPATSLEVLQKYAGSDAKVPKLNRLNSPEWKKTKTRVKGAVKEIAGELVELYAKRQAKKGHCFEKDTV